MGKLFEELKRRKVFRVAAVYAVVAWVLIQVTDVVLPTFGAPEWVNQTIIFLFVLGFLPTLIAAWAYDVTPEGVKADNGLQFPQQTTNSTDRNLIYAILVLVLLVAAFQIADRFLYAPRQADRTVSDAAASQQSPAVMRSSIQLGQPLTRHSVSRIGINLDLTPDGTKLEYIMYSGVSSEQLFIRDMATQETQIFNTQMGAPSVSPDGKRVMGSLGSTGDRRIEIVEIESGTSQIIPLAMLGGSQRWASNDEVFYTASDSRTVNRRSLINGADVALTQMDDSATGSHVADQALPGGGSFLFTSRSRYNRSANYGEIKIHDIANETTKTLIEGGYKSRYARSGHIVFVRSGDLWAAPFDIESSELTGLAVRVIEGVESFPMSSYSSYDFSESGRLIYLPGEEIVPLGAGLNWIDRLGNTEEIALPEGSYADPELSASGDLLALTVIQDDATSDIWVVDLTRGTFGRRTFVGSARNPKWSPDSRGLVYQLAGEGVWRVNADGSGQPEQLTLEATAQPGSFTGSDDDLLYQFGELGAGGFKTLSYSDGTWLSTPLLNFEYNEWGGVVSPDGRWLAYTSDESGRFEVYVHPYPDVDSGKWQISTEGGRESRWSANGQELFYMTFDDELMSVSIDTTSSFLPGPPQLLLSDFPSAGTNPPSFAVTADGQRFIQFRRAELPNPREGTENVSLMVVENWFEELKRLAPPNSQ